MEFLQWMKRYWDAHYDGGNGAAVSVAPPVPVAVPKVTPAVKTNNLTRTASVTKRPISSTIPNTPIPNTQQTSPQAPTVVHSAASAANALQLAALTKTITELKLSVDEMEKERDFYFNKLRDIEILTQKISDPVITSSIFFKQITEILYTTEEGFEIPQETVDKEKEDAVMASAA